jgi:hypothetical protein
VDLCHSLDELTRAAGFQPLASRALTLARSEPVSARCRGERSDRSGDTTVAVSHAPLRLWPEGHRATLAVARVGCAPPSLNGIVYQNAASL